MEESDFIKLVASIASRLRHDLKGGLISLRMGLQALADEEDLKALLIERTEALEALADKLISLLRMAKVNPKPVALLALLGEFKLRAKERFPDLEIELPQSYGVRPALDSDALLYALLEVAENSSLAGAKHLRLSSSLGENALKLTLVDDGPGFAFDASRSTLSDLSEVGCSGWGRSGLGLAIVRACILSHGGDISFTQDSPSGFKIEITLASKSA